MRYRWLLVLIYAVILAVASLLPSGSGPLNGWDASFSPSLQNLLHLPAYTVLVCLLLMALARPTKPTGTRPIVLSATVCVVYGVLLECLQAAGIPGRWGSVSDVLWNMVGVVVGVAVWILFRKASRSSKACKATTPRRPASIT